MICKKRLDLVDQQVLQFQSNLTKGVRIKLVEICIQETQVVQTPA